MRIFSGGLSTECAWARGCWGWEWGGRRREPEPVGRMAPEGPGGVATAPCPRGRRDPRPSSPHLGVGGGGRMRTLEGGEALLEIQAPLLQPRAPLPDPRRGAIPSPPIPSPLPSVRTPPPPPHRGESGDQGLSQWTPGAVRPWDTNPVAGCRRDTPTPTPTVSLRNTELAVGSLGVGSLTCSKARVCDKNRWL